MFFGLIQQSATPQLSPQEQQALTQLADIQLPPAVSPWPPSPLLAAIVIIAIAAIVLSAVLWWRKRRVNAYRRRALRAYLELREQQSDLNTAQVISELNVLLKRTCYSALPTTRKFVSNLHGEPWYEFLQGALPAGDSCSSADIKLWSELEYGPNRSENLNALFNFSRHWILRHDSKRLREFCKPKGGAN